MLLVLSKQTLTRQAVSLCSHTGGIIAALYRAREAAQISLAYRRKAHQMRLALAMALVAGEVTLARRMSAGAIPPLLNASHVRVCILQCAPGERDPIAATYEDASGYHGRGLMVRCPVYDDHLICLAGAACSRRWTPPPG
ncbi:hypothetical protein [Sphaerisporangium corydalis]|uniref:Uncharacterized protein n=1 Tax=Sphaerisporangium corydalis TaxID=1441875 RepID=A0ABV9EHG1_9ACTN|nr:hypothetical protein [Sphaerisporangium corydalis]